MPSECHRELTKSRREMDPEGVGVSNPPHSPSADRVSSAADAMLKLSTVPMFIVSSQAQVSSVAPVTPIGEPQVVAMANSMANTMPQVVTTQTTIPQVCIANLPHVGEERNTGNISSEDGSSHRSFIRLSRKQREFIPEPSKDEQYWLKRRKNNEAAKRSREKRRMNDVVMGQRIMELTNERNYVQQELERIKKHFGLPLDKVFRPSGPETPSNSGSASEGPVVTPTLNTVPAGASRTPADINIPQIIPVSVANHLTHMQRSHQAVTAALTSTYKSSNTDTDTQQQQQHFYPQKVLPPVIPRIMDERSVSTSGIMTSLSNPPVCTTQPHQHLPIVDSTTLPREQQQHHQSLMSAQLYSGAHHHHPQQHQQQQQQQQQQQHQHQPQPIHQQSQHAFHQEEVQPIHIFPNTTPQGTEPNDAADFHSQMKVPDICEPISPASSSSTTPDLTISLSAGSSSDNSDGDHSQLSHLREAPLNLSTRQVMTSDTNTGTNSTNTTDWGVPLKLRYKAANYEYEMEQEQDQEQENEHNNSHTDCSSRSSCCSIQEFRVGSSVGGESCENAARKKSGEPTTTKYIERRKKNNFAARKCRENRRFLCNMKIMKSAVLESENQQLRDEMRTLAGEVQQLKELIEQKKEAASKGEPFDLPPVPETMAESSDKKPVL